MNLGHVATIPARSTVNLRRLMDLLLCRRACQPRRKSIALLGTRTVPQRDWALRFGSSADPSMARTAVHPEPTFGAGAKRRISPLAARWSGAGLHGRLGRMRKASSRRRERGLPVAGLTARWHIPEMPLPRIQPIAPTWRKEPLDDPAPWLVRRHI
jgi:hypothetical protein